METSKRHNEIIAALLAALATFILYLPSLSNGFVDWDDNQYVYDNPGIRSLGIAFWKWVFTSEVAANWHPLTIITYALEYGVWGLNPFGYHLTNSVLHSINAALVCFLAIRIIKISKASIGGKGLFAAGLITALLFGLHPIHVESVAWISERKDVLSGLFFILSVLSYLRYIEGKRKAYYLSLIWFALALMSKPMAITLPAVLLLLDFYPLKRPASELKRAVIEKIPFFMLSIAAAILTIWAQAKGNALAPKELYPLGERILVALRAPGFYIYKLFVPLDLVPFYVRPLGDELTDIYLFLSIAFIIAMTAISLALMKRTRALFAAWLFYLITILPVTGIIQVSDHAAADRYMYLPSLSIFMLLGATAGRCLGGKKIAISALIAVFTIIMPVLAWKQTGAWKDTISLWTKEIKTYPVLPAYIKRADAYLSAGKYLEAASDYTIIINNSGLANPDDGLDRIYVNRGIALINLQRNDLALKDLGAAILLNPENAAAYKFRAAAYRELGNTEAALADLAHALKLSPEDAAAHFASGLIYSEKGDKASAQTHMEKAAGLGLPEAKQFLEAR